MKPNKIISSENGSPVSMDSHIGTVVGVAIYKERGTNKKQVPHIDLKEGFGVLGDGHAGTEKQVSLVAKEEIDYMNRTYGLQANIGDFAENIATQGIDLMSFSPGDQLQVGPAILKIVRLGKDPEEMKTHTFSFEGYTLLPKKGLFCKVLKGGKVKPGDKISAIGKNI